MDAERWQRLSPLLDALLELDPASRAQRLEQARAEDPDMAVELERLLQLEQDNDDFLAQPIVVPPPGPRAGAQVGPYQLERLLGEGGMGQVWSASRADGLYQRRVALKLLRPGLADPNLRLRFTRERQILARLEHPHIARLLDAGISSDGQPYLALEYVDGEPITDWVRARDLPLDARLALFLQICDAVSHAHANLIVHRDLKPSNILVTPLDEVRLLDFGIAKLLDGGEHAPEHTRTGTRAFTLHYAAPEQVRGEPVTTMTDVYALGVVLYELLADDRPYQLKRKTDAEWEEAILSADPPRPSQTLLRSADDGNDRDRAAAIRRRARQVAGDLDNITLKALSKRPEQRYASVEALAQDVMRQREGKPVQARPQSLRYRLGKYVHRHRWALSTGAFIVVVLVAALGIVTWQAQQAVREASRAQAMQDFIIGLFEQAGGTQARGPLDVRKLLDAGVQRGSRELAMQPQARAELFGVIARLRIVLGDYPQALDLLRRQQTLIATLPDAPESLRLSSTTDLGRTQRLLGHAGDCVASMQDGEPLARDAQSQLPVQASMFYSELGRCRRVLGQQAAARLLFQRSLALRRNRLDDNAGVAENLADLAGLESDVADVPGALRGYRGALAQLQSSVGPRHPLAIDLQRNLCRLERDSGDLQRAESDCRNALALARELLGDQHPTTIDTSRQLAAVHIDQGAFREAQQELRDSWNWQLARLGAPDTNAARDLRTLGLVSWQLGDARTALRQLDQAISIVGRARDPVLEADMLLDKASVLHASGQDDAAKTTLQQARARYARAPGDHRGQLGVADRLAGEIDAAAGDPDAAATALRSATSATTAAYGSGHAFALRAQLAQLREQARSGEDVLSQIDQLAGLPGNDASTQRLRWRARAYAAEARCRGDDKALGAEQIDALASELSLAFPEGGELVREASAIRGACTATPTAPPQLATSATTR